MNRRGFLGALARAPVVGAIAGKALRDEAAAKLAGVSLSGLNGGGPEPPFSTIGSEPSPSQWQSLLRDFSKRSQIEAMLYEMNRGVYSLDPDLAVNRSFSLAAKIVYQRQHNVARRIEELQNEHPWRRLNNMVCSWIKLW